MFYQSFCSGGSLFFRDGFKNSLATNSIKMRGNISFYSTLETLILLLRKLRNVLISSKFKKKYILLLMEMQPLRACECFQYNFLSQGIKAVPLYSAWYADLCLHAPWVGHFLPSLPHSTSLKTKRKQTKTMLPSPTWLVIKFSFIGCQHFPIKRIP